MLETPPNILGIIDDHWFNYVGDVGNAGPDRGKGGKFLLLPPGYDGEVPSGYFVFRSTTFGNVFFWRGFLVNGDPGPAVENTRKFTRVYPLALAANPPAMKFVNVPACRSTRSTRTTSRFSRRSTTSCRRNRRPR